jgi:predicted MFS family arabinose efflux permease
MRTLRGFVPRPSAALAVTAAAAALFAIAMGVRSAFGLFISPLNSATGLGIAAISFALAVSQLVGGIAHPAVGLLAERFGAVRVIAIGGVLLGVTTAAIAWADTTTELVLVLALSAAAGSAVGSNGILISIVHRYVSEARRGLASGIVSAGGSAGQMLIAPAAGAALAVAGWANALYALAFVALAVVPVAFALAPSARRDAAAPAPASPAPAARAGLRDALTSPLYWGVTMAFFVCGFHVAFLLAHMPGVVELCGLPPRVTGAWLGIAGLCNIVGSIGIGYVIRHVAMTRTLGALYAARAVGIAVFLLLPKSEAVLLGFAVWMGVTYMATLPPTVGVIGQAFGVARLGSLFGVTMFVHQLGSFLGVWLGGIAVEATGSYDLLWGADMGLALVATAICLWLREPAAVASPDAVGAPPQGRLVGALGGVVAVAAVRVRQTWRAQEPVRVTIPAAARYA